MRGGSVAILVILKCEGTEYALLVRQTSLPTGEHLFPAIPAGMLDGEGHFAGVAAKVDVIDCTKAHFFRKSKKKQGL
jgi:hypothetical protein